MKYPEFEDTFSLEEATLAWEDFCVAGKNEDENITLTFEKEMARDKETPSWNCPTE